MIKLAERYPYYPSCKVVFTAGTWDLFHKGHLNILKKSKSLGDKLIVAVSSDKLVKKYKKVLPIFHYKHRLDIIKSCRYVDVAVKQETLVPIYLLKKYEVNVITIGSDWKDKKLEGLEWAKNNSIEIVYLSYTKGVSTSEVKKKIINNSYNIIRGELNREQDRKV